MFVLVTLSQSLLLLTILDWRLQAKIFGQNRETANVGLDSSVGRAPARQSLFIQIYLKYVPSQFPLWFIT